MYIIMYSLHILIKNMREIIKKFCKVSLRGIAVRQKNNFFLN